MGRADSPLRDRVIFVDGAPRSGTTWLVRLLALHPDIAGVEAESHLFDYGVDRLFDNLEYKHPTLRGLALYLEREELVDLSRDLCDGVLMAMRAHVSGATTPEFVVEKTPVGARTDGLDLERKRDCYPDAWYVHIVRDREEVTRSLMRSPFMEDRSREGCAGLWDRVVGDIRRTLGGASRYREVNYADLRADPVSTCREVFAWLGVDTGEDALEAVRALAPERVSDVGAVGQAAQGTRAALRTRAGRVVTRARAEVRGRLAVQDEALSEESNLTFVFMQAMHRLDADTLRSLCHPKLEYVHRSPEGDAWIEGEQAPEAVVRLAEDIFGRRYVGEWWGSAGGGQEEFWSSAPGKPFTSFFFSGVGGDGTRVDVAIALLLEDGRIRRAVVVSAGPLSGRPIAPQDRSATAS
jgi:hypothetical protein